ncbi:hypothetical protein K490DRAFT_61871 [Saccharata proteae CBS 121410]|uniref:Uncharacterized protein n=1 Tax=Saccharata proteae CBS 121410 TaxID=1314787 RepID=A0A9P4M0U6_9PEZI|nr:hypothetical protein K490DRAFT_61871 [Saccharata proteae CBS 121410]
MDGFTAAMINASSPERNIQTSPKKAPKTPKTPKTPKKDTKKNREPSFAEKMEDIRRQSKRTSEPKSSETTTVEPIRTTKKTTEEFKERTLWIGVYAHGTAIIHDGYLSTPDELDTVYPSRIEASLHHPAMHPLHETAEGEKRRSGLKNWANKFQSTNGNHVSLAVYSENFRCPVVMEKKGHNLDKICCLKMAIRIPRVEHEGRVANDGDIVQQYIEYHDAFVARCHNIRTLKLRYIMASDQKVCSDLADTEVPTLYTEPVEQQKRLFFEKFLLYTTMFPGLESLTIQIIIEKGLAMKKVELVTDKILEGRDKGEWTQIPTWPTQQGEVVDSDDLTTFDHLGNARTRYGMTRAQTGLSMLATAPSTPSMTTSDLMRSLELGGPGPTREHSRLRHETSPSPAPHAVVGELKRSESLTTREHYRR